MTLLAIVFLAALILGAYFLGLADGRLEEKEKHLFERMDNAIAKVRKP